MPADRAGASRCRMRCRVDGEGIHQRVVLGRRQRVAVRKCRRQLLVGDRTRLDIGEVDVGEVDRAGLMMGLGVLVRRAVRVLGYQAGLYSGVMTGLSSLPVIVIVTGWVDVAPKLSVTVTL